MKPVDSHCHLYFEQFDSDRDEVIDRARERLEFVCVPGCDPESNQKVIELAKENNGFVVPNLGLHPTSTSAFDKVDEVKKQIRQEDPAAIGEIGLDHHHVKKKEERVQQENIFREMLELAEELDKPVVVHSREAEKKCIEILEEHKLEDVMMHCFNGKPRLAEKIASNGWMTGITTQIIYSSRVEAILEKLDIEDILLETDSPFLYPNGRNQPVHVLESAERIAELKYLDQKDVIKTTTENARKFFNR